MNEQDLVVKLKSAVDNLNSVLDELAKNDIYANLGVYGQETSSGFVSSRSVINQGVVKVLKPVEIKLKG
jgi:hypothetical protein|nr:MAG TPA: hypothetical protein [Caudoviricetes sp.]